MRTLFDSFNARNLSPEEVAETFVPPQDFSRLWANNHVALMGPRGSGKTTLLKMLTLPALHRWNHQQAGTVLEEMKYTAVYIPTDIHWQHQLQYANRGLDGASDLRQLFSEAAVTTNVLTAFCTSLAYVIHYADNITADRQVQFCEDLVREWRLPPTLPTLPAVKQALHSRINDLYLVAQRLAGLPWEEARNQVPDYFYIDYLMALSAASGAFDRWCTGGSESRWALCFDELELAPEWLQIRLFAELRSTDERFLFKLSTSPIPHALEATHASPRQDFAVIRLWPHLRHDAQGFSDALVTSYIERRFGGGVTPEDLLGASPLATDDYARGSATWKSFRNMARTDLEFKALLESRGLSPDDPATEDADKRDQVLRKAKPLVLFREAFTKPGPKGRVVLRTRKVPTLYCGRDSIYRVSDGNPRWLIGIVNDLFSNNPPDAAQSARPVSQNRQAQVLDSAATQFVALVKAVPTATWDATGSHVDLYALLKTIGEFFFHKIVIDDFQLDPVGSFVVDERVPGAVLKLLRVAVYQGAIVFVNPEEYSIESEMVGKRFRISYMLAPHFKLPLRLYKETMLNSILQQSPDWRVKLQQRDMFGGETQ